MLFYFFVFLGIILGINLLLAGISLKKINRVFAGIAPLLTVMLFLWLAPISDQRGVPEGPCGNPAAAHAFIQLLRWGTGLLLLIPTLVGIQIFLNRSLLGTDVIDVFRRKQ